MKNLFRQIFAVRNLVLISVLLIFVSIGGAQTFDSETDIKNPARIPSGVLKILQQTPQVKECIENDGAGKKFSASWFQAAKVDLNGDKYADYVVKNLEGCLNGPRAATFWIFRANAKSFTQVFEDSVLALSIRKTRTAGFRDIETETTMMNIIRNRWKFDGRKYKLRSTKIIEPR